MTSQTVTVMAVVAAVAPVSDEVDPSSGPVPVVLTLVIVRAGTAKLCWTWGCRVVVGVAGLVGVDDAGAGARKVKTDPLVPPEVQTAVEPEVKVTGARGAAVAAGRVGGPADGGAARRRRGEGDGLVALDDAKLCWTWGAAL